MSDGPALSSSGIEQVFRAEYGRAVAVLVRVLGDIDAAEEAVQDAFLTAVQQWPSRGLPPSPAGWIITTARRRAIDRLRRESSRADRQARAGQQPGVLATMSAHAPWLAGNVIEPIARECRSRHLVSL